MDKLRLIVMLCLLHKSQNFVMYAFLKENLFRHIMSYYFVKISL